MSQNDLNFFPPKSESKTKNSLNNTYSSNSKPNSSISSEKSNSSISSEKPNNSSSSEKSNNSSSSEKSNNSSSNDDKKSSFFSKFLSSDDTKSKDTKSSSDKNSSIFSKFLSSDDTKSKETLNRVDFTKKTTEDTSNKSSDGKIFSKITEKVKNNYTLFFSTYTFWNFFKIFILVIIIAALGFNIFLYLAEGTDFFKNILINYGNFIPVGILQTLKLSAIDVKGTADSAQTKIDKIEKKVKKRHKYKNELIKKKIQKKEKLVVQI